MSQFSHDAIDPLNLEQAAQPTAGEELSISYSGRAAPIAKIQLFNLLMLIPTLGVYRFWAITRLRRYFWSSISINGTKLEYTGRGLELFLGLLFVLLFLIPLTFGVGFLLNFLILLSETLFNVVYFLLLICISCLSIVAIYFRRRYILSRTKWRGIRLALHGTASNFFLFDVKQTFLLIITLVLYTPFFAMNIQQKLWNNTHVGDQRMNCERIMNGLMLRFLGVIASYISGYIAIALIVYNAITTYSMDNLFTSIIITTVIWYFVFFWALSCYQARIYHNVIEGLSFQKLFFRSEFKGSHLIKTYLIASGIVFIAGAILFSIAGANSYFSIFSNGLIYNPEDAFMNPSLYFPFLIASFLTYIVSLFVIPVVVTHRLFRDLVATTAIGGTFEPDTIAQSDEELLSRGEGLANALEVGGF
ncbi:MAG: DUF898 family protein [Alphaproteobacteria bacterium]